MVINGVGRQALDAALQDDFTTLFLLLGPVGSKAEEVHEMMEQRRVSWDPHQRWFLLHDQAALKAEENWFMRTHVSGYVVLHNGPMPKEVAARGPVLNLLTNDKPDFLKVRREFLKGDL